MFEQDAIDEGLGFDGSSIRGFKVINESDMLLLPDPTTAFIDPFMAHKTLVMIADIKDPVTKEFYSRDPRGVAKKAEAYLKSTGIGDTAYFGPEAEFFVFDNVQYGTGQQYSSYYVDSREGHWNTQPRRGPEPRLQDPAEGRLLPLPAQRHAAGPARRDGADHDQHRPHGRMPAP